MPLVMETETSVIQSCWEASIRHLRRLLPRWNSQAQFVNFQRGVTVERSIWILLCNIREAKRVHPPFSFDTMNQSSRRELRPHCRFTLALIPGLKHFHSLNLALCFRFHHSKLPACSRETLTTSLSSSQKLGFSLHDVACRFHIIFHTTLCHYYSLIPASPGFFSSGLSFCDLSDPHKIWLASIFPLCSGFWLRLIASKSI
jgi:hypothetical protein